MRSLQTSLVISIGKRLFYGLWILLILGILITCIKNPDILSPEALAAFISRYEDTMLFMFVLLTLIRGFFLIPSTPFVIGGTLLFPDQLVMVFIISMLGIMVTATALYYFSDLLGFSHYLERKYPKPIAKCKARLTGANATLLVFGWAFFPLVPTDIICYVSGLIKMPFKYMFLGVLAGELILVTAYIYFGAFIPVSFLS
jgi:uncharacterized membrane protein YdjX (TVP38/TMEM64 family)